MQVTLTDFLKTMNQVDEKFNEFVHYNFLHFLSKIYENLVPSLQDILKLIFSLYKKMNEKRNEIFPTNFMFKGEHILDLYVVV